MNKTLILLGVMLCLVVCSAKVAFKRSLVVSTPPTPESTFEHTNEVEKENAAVKLQIYEMRVDTNVSNRYAQTQITSKVRNLGSKAREATFSIVTPDKAFISGFTMEIDGKKYEAYVQGKEEAKQSYDKAVSRGQSAAHVAASARDSNRFTVSVNVEPDSKATFYLRYEELLVRKHEKYELVLNIHPGQPVKNLDIEVNIAESRPLKFVKTPSLRSGNEISKNKSNVDPEADIKTVNETSAVVTFKPDVIKQKLFAVSMGGKEEDGLSGQFVVQYDVVRDPQGGDVLVHGGYFVHFFAPEDLPPLKKQVIFVLDNSGSMGGRKIDQLKKAMDSILGELNGEDIFSIVEFSSTVHVWNIPNKNSIRIYSEEQITQEKNKMQSVNASEDHIKKAREIIQNLVNGDLTNIIFALKTALNLVTINEDQKSHQPIIVFLTDGEPNVDESNPTRITSTITELNTKKIPIFSLSFGDGADRDFLQKLSLKNQGFARHIYEAADANLQLEDFYKEISSPLLSDVTFKYVDQVKNVTKRHFPILFRGGELFTTGIITDSNFTARPVECWGTHGPIQFQPKVYHATGSLERLWAYLTVKQLLEQRNVANDKKELTQEALRLALKYSFVTDVSSLVVVKPNASSAVNTEDAAKSGSDSDRNYDYDDIDFFDPRGLPCLTDAQGLGHPSATYGSSGGGFQYIKGFSGPPGLQAPPSYGYPRGGLHYPQGLPGLAYPQSQWRQSSSYGFPGSGPKSYLGLPGAVYFGPPSLSYDSSGVGLQYPQGRSGVPYPHGFRRPSLSYGPLLTTPASFVGVQYESTTMTIVNDIFSKIPWLKNSLNDNDTLTLDSGTYSLGLNETVSLQPACSNSLNGTAGTCALLHECPQIHKELTDLVTYKKHFCNLQSFAGVCCPVASVGVKGPKE